MPLPEIIPVKYSEEEAEYLSLRPVVRQTFRMRELVDLILSVTGKDSERVRQVLRSGTAVFHFYRYWWQGFDANEAELEQLLAEFPDAQPERRFAMEECTKVRLEAGAGRGILPLEKQQAAKRPLLRRGSMWDCVAELARRNPPCYSHYAYDQRADCFVASLTAEDGLQAQRDLLRHAPRGLRKAVGGLPVVHKLSFFCPRK